MTLINIGFGSMVAARRILAIMDPDSAGSQGTGHAD